ncbi:uncharacterized protein LOC131682268 [Topomyia yanbarensis]|uniref:uncharacterized protein LOC131682268 n=1 Tax=Topomyia yanbarensis TaxID=2498891 RepID=UPI00273C2807|nr:uncharacterized protein LOC131682268 [Topomyia yanbarensis]XP_058819620.1 uncharacterized protein LOC131682268 [Topomyia yanbarensis]XP_058819621.1 uncharacterized protein LOC131682268 [Topomyia yanbarensis]
MESQSGVQQNIVIRRRSSLYSSGPGSSPNIYKPSYEKQLSNEIENWSRLLRNKVMEINEHMNTQIQLDNSVLSTEQQQYLALGPKVDEFSKQSDEINSLLERYIQRKSFLAQRYDAILGEARAQADNKALSIAEKRLLSEQIK